MNPFDLGGPAFLLFYVVVATLVILGGKLLRHALEGGAVPRFTEADPYLLAYLRDGADEAIRVATVALVDRGLLSREGDRITATADAIHRARRPIERAILGGAQTTVRASDLVVEAGPRAACDALATELKTLGLLPTREQITARVLLGLGSVGFLWWLTYTKIEIALSRGRHNFAFLVVFSLVVPVAVFALHNARKTTLGDRVLEDFRTLFSRLHGRREAIQMGGATNELALIAGLYGVHALAGVGDDHASELFPRRVKEGVFGQSGTSCGGSSCGSSGGSSCGGGGCGGGCGGCGS